MIEEWKVVTKYNDLKYTYEVSNFGRVRNVYTDKILATGEDAFGYKTVQLTAIKKNERTGRHVRKTAKIHRILAEEFIPNPENKETVNHKDGNKHNNHISNLEWATRHEQLIHAYDLGLKTPDRGSSNVNSKLNDEQVREIRSLYKKGDKKGLGASKIGERYGVNETTILNIVNHRTYKDIQ